MESTCASFCFAFEFATWESECVRDLYRKSPVIEPKKNQKKKKKKKSVARSMRNRRATCKMHLLEIRHYLVYIV